MLKKLLVLFLASTMALTTGCGGDAEAEGEELLEGEEGVESAEVPLDEDGNPVERDPNALPEGAIVTKTTTTTILTQDGETEDTVTEAFIVDASGELTPYTVPPKTTSATRDSCPVYYESEIVTISQGSKLGNLTVKTYIPYFTDDRATELNGIKAVFDGTITITGVIFPDKTAGAGYLFEVDPLYKHLLPQFNVDEKYPTEDPIIFSLLFPNGVATPQLTANQQQPATITLNRYELITMPLSMPCFGTVVGFSYNGQAQPYVEHPTFLASTT